LNLKRGASRHFVQPLAGLDPTPKELVANGESCGDKILGVSAEGRFWRGSEQRQAEPYSRGSKVSLFFRIA
jgi:hypothetical protein